MQASPPRRSQPTLPHEPAAPRRLRKRVRFKVFGLGFSGTLTSDDDDDNAAAAAASRQPGGPPQPTNDKRGPSYAQASALGSSRWVCRPRMPPPGGFHMHGGSPYYSLSSRRRPVRELAPTPSERRRPWQMLSLLVVLRRSSTFTSRAAVRLPPTRPASLFAQPPL